MRVLFVPHVPAIHIINRVYEFALGTDGYFLIWELENHTLWAKITSQLRSLFRLISLKNELMQVPLLFKPQKLAVQWNTLMLNRAVKKYQIDIVVNANALLFDVSKISVPVIYDLVDDHLEINRALGLTASRIEKIKKDIRNAKGVVCVTEQLEQKAKQLNPCTVTIENGLYLDRFSASRSLKKALGIEGKKVYGYIGGVEAWTGIDRACEAYLKIRNDRTAMIVVGNSESMFFRSLKQTYRDAIYFVGAVPPSEVGNYFKSIDVGMIPFVLNDFTHNALPIKALEYGLAGAQVISTPLRALEAKQFPFVHFASIEMFDRVMQSLERKEMTFDFTAYSWEKQSEKLMMFVKECANG